MSTENRSAAEVRGPELTASLSELRYLVFEGMKGETGDPGPAGAPGAAGRDGSNGTDGVSPEITITSVFNGRRIKITDKEHPQGQTFEVYNGTNGHSPYIDSTTGTWWYYDEVLPDWVDSGIRAEGADGDDYVLTSQDKTDIAAIVLQALPTWNGGAY